MARLTYDCAVGDSHCWQIKGADNDLCEETCRRYAGKGCGECPIKVAFDKLAEYENICDDPGRLARALGPGTLT